MHLNFSKTHFQRVATRKSRWAGNYEVFVAGKGYVTRYGMVKKPGKIVFYLPNKLICSKPVTTTGAYKYREHWQECLWEETKCAQISNQNKTGMEILNE